MILNEQTKRNIENNFIPNANALLIFILITVMNTIVTELLLNYENKV